MAQAIFRYGNPLMVPYTPSGAITAGDVIVEGDKCYIAHHDIAANVEGAVAAGGGVYECLKNTGTGTGTAIGAKAYWNDSSNYVEEASSLGTVLGWFAADSADGDETCMVEHGAF